MSRRHKDGCDCAGCRIRKDPTRIRKPLKAIDHLRQEHAELLDALEGLYSAMRLRINAQGTHNSTTELRAMGMAQAAIAKAKGQDS